MSNGWSQSGQSNDENNNAENLNSSLQRPTPPPPDLSLLRSEIDSIDSQLTTLLARRFEITEEIGKLKGRLGLKVKDEAREEKVLSQVAQHLSGSNSKNFILSIFKLLLKESVELQETSDCALEAEGKIDTV